MTRANSAVAGLLLAAAAIVPAAKAVTLEVVAVGASASWQTAAIGAYNQLAGASAGHYTIKGTCTSGNCAQVHDVRSASIPPDGGNLWVIWNKAQTQVWAYISVDAIVGVRAFMANPRGQLQIDPETETTPGQNLIASSLWGSDASALPAAIYNALNNATFTVAFSGLRPEDAKFIASRVLSPLNQTTYSGLGYGTGPTDLIGTEILSSFSGSTANPVDFNLKGTDPFSSLTVKTWKTINVGAQATIFVTNRKDLNGLGAGGSIPVFTDLPDGVAQTIFEGRECDTDAFGALGAPANVPITAILTEPLGANANVPEYTIFRDKANPDGSQETGVNPANAGNNPLNAPCATVNGVAGNRRRAIGVSEDVSSGVVGVTDSIAYVSFSYGNVSKIAGSASYGYLTRNGVDGIQTSGTYSTGELPTCASPCPVTPGSSFPNVRNGTYKDWTIVTTVTAASGADLTKTVLLVNAIQNNLNTTVPDFVPFAAVGGDPGLKIYRSHYLQSGYAPNNGLGGQKEAGGDVGGCIEPVGPPPGVLSCHQ